MSHNVEQMFSVGRPSWHGHNDTNVPNKVTWKKALTLSGTGWEVFKAPLYALVNPAEVEQGEEPQYGPIPTSDSWGIVRDSDLRPLGTVGSRYVPIQNHEAAKFASDLLDVAEATFVTGGSLGIGNIVWYCLELPKEIKVGDLDTERIVTYLSVINRHDGKGAFKAIVSPTRIECQNTMRMALGNAKAEHSIRHTVSATQRLDEVRQALKFSYAYTDEFEAEMAALLSKSATAKTFDKVYEAVWTPPEDETRKRAVARWKNRHEEIQWVWENSPNIPDDIRSTQYGILNAYTEWAQWGRSYRGSGGDPTKQDALRVSETLLGRTALYNQAVFDALRSTPAARVTKARRKVVAKTA